MLGPGVLRERFLSILIGAAVDAVAKRAARLDAEGGGGQTFIKEFLYEVAKVELNLVANRLGLRLTTYSHPLSAVRGYRKLMCRSGIYRSPGEVKPRPDEGFIAMKMWKCAYSPLCGRNSGSICVRGYALGYAVDAFSPARFAGLEIVDRDGKGGCTVRLKYEGEAIPPSPPEEEVENGDDTRKLSRSETTELSLKAWVLGIEAGVAKTMGAGEAGEFLRNLYTTIAAEALIEIIQVDAVAGLPLTRWGSGAQAGPNGAGENGANGAAHTNGAQGGAKSGGHA